MKLPTKKRSVLLLSLLLLLGTGCKAATPAPSSATTSTPPSTEEAASSQSTATVRTVSQVPLQIAALKGPTAMGMAPMMENSAAEGTSSPYKFSIVASPDEIVPAIAQGKTDLAAIPANMASILYNKTEKGIKVLAVNTLGVLYLVENGNAIHSPEDLKGKTVYLAGKGATPEYALNYVLQQAGLEPGKDVVIEYKSEHAECVSMLAQDSPAIALLPEPFVSASMMKNPKIRVALDLNKVWEQGAEKSGGKSPLITGVLIARSEVLEKSPEAIKSFLADYKSSVEFVNRNIPQAAAMIGKLGIVPAPVAEKAIPNCHITYLDGSPMKDALSNYLNILFSQNPQITGGQLPDENFYYQP